MKSAVVTVSTPDLTAAAKQLAERLSLPFAPAPETGLALVLTPQRLELRQPDQPRQGAVLVDFVGGAVAHRRKFGGGRGQAIAKACGLKKGALPHVLDATAGLGRDAFVLASLGCRVDMIERSPVVAALLEDGLARAGQDPEIGGWVRERMTLRQGSALELLGDWPGDRPEVIYLDPMFPHRDKSALVKKEMRVFQALVGADPDADALLPAALALASRRVVVKRPDYAPWLNQHKPHSAITTKKNRFDLYIVS